MLHKKFKSKDHNIIITMFKTIDVILKFVKLLIIR
jgi:hypothetical protein